MKIKATKLTFYGGRLYAAGETIEIAEADADVVAGHYGIDRKAAAPAAPAKGKKADPAPEPQA